MQTKQIKRVQYFVIGTLIALAGLTVLAMAGENSDQVLGIHDLQQVAG